jgi:AraC-like DNA-binding protein
MTVQWISRLGPYCEAACPQSRSRRLWRHEAGFDLETPPHRVLPDTRLSLVIERRHDRSGALIDDQRRVFGPIRTPRLYAPAPGTVLEGVFLAPEEAMSWLGVRPDELEDAIASQDEFPQLTHNPPLPSRAPDRLAIWAGRVIRRMKGQVRTSTLAQRAGVSERHLNRAMKDRLGTGAKILASQIRTLAAIEAADACRKPDWADIALASGYSDQAHLSRAIKAMTGLSPVVLHAERSAESEIFKTRPHP